MPPEAMQLTLEQSFELRRIADTIPNLPEQHCRDLLLEMARLIMVKDNMLKHFIKTSVGTAK